MEEILALDRELFQALNSNFHTPWLDQLMMLLSTTTVWIPLHLLLLYLIIATYKKDCWIVLLAVGLTILLADQITSAFMKPFFERLRPSHEPGLRDTVHIVNQYRGGKFGFASSHAANTFGVAALMWFSLKRYRPWIGLLFVWSALVGYTRIYLGVHYPGDIVVGFLVGFLSAVIAYFTWVFIRNYLEKRKALRSGIQ